jgi:bacterioferritin-associated ferredoxin
MFLQVLSGHAVRGVMTAAGPQPRAPCDVYGCLGCSAQCGRCARTIRRIMDEVLGFRLLSR